MTRTGAEYLIAGDAMFPSHWMELLIVMIVALLLFGKRLPLIMRQRGIDFPDERWGANDVMFLKAIVMALVALLSYFLLNSR